MILTAYRNNETTQGDLTAVVKDLKVLEELGATNNSHSNQDHTRGFRVHICNTFCLCVVDF